MPLIQLTPERVINTDHIIQIKPQGFVTGGCVIVMRDDVQILYGENVEDTLIHIRRLCNAK